MLKYEVMLCNQMWRMQEAMKKGVRNFIAEEDGDLIGAVLLIVIIVGVAILFKDKIEKLVTDMWQDIFNKSSQITGGGTTAGGAASGGGF